MSCKVELLYEVRIGGTEVVRRTVLDVPSDPVEVVQIEPPGPKWVDLDIAETLKGHGLGDFEDVYGLDIPSLRQLWTDLSARSPEEAAAFLREKKEEEAEKSKEKIEILGEALNGNLTILIASVLEFCLMIYLLAQLFQVQAMLPEFHANAWDSPFFGVMRSSLGRSVMFSTLVFPVLTCIFVLVAVLPPFQSDWPGPEWMIGVVSRWFLISAVAITDLLLILRVRGIFGALQQYANRNCQAQGKDSQPKDDPVPEAELEIDD